MASAIFRAIKEYKIEIDSVILDTYKKEQDFQQNQLFFSVQFLSSKEKINIDELDIKNKDMIYEFYNNQTYQYSYGSVNNLEQVSSLKKKLISYGFKDCFTIAILDGKKMSLSEALSILK